MSCVEIFHSYPAFTRTEAARLASVGSSQLGRWARQIHGAAPSRYELPTIAMAAVLGSLARAGFRPAEFVPVVRLVALPVLTHCEDARSVGIEVEGAPFTEAERWRLLEEARRDRPAQAFAWFPLPLRVAGDPLASVYLFADLEEARARTISAPAGLLLDLAAIGAGIAARAPRPLVTYTVKEAAA